MNDRLDRWVSAPIRAEIERRFYAKINAQADLRLLIDDPGFMAAPHHHVGLFADHGVVHVRDVARQILDVLTTAHGTLIPPRSAHRFALMQGLGVLLAYFHDIGMVDFSQFGRAMHPEFAAQAVFDPALDDLVDWIWQENSGGLAWQLLLLAERGVLQQDPKLTLRELLSLSICHSKSKIPVALLNDPVALRARMVDVISTDLRVLAATQGARIPEAAGAQADVDAPSGVNPPFGLNPHMARFAHLFPHAVYGWLAHDHPLLRELAEDVIDTARALRAADALRQRGTVLETSGHYQVFVDQHRGNAVYALRLDADRLFALELSDPISAGEANVAGTELDPAGDLRISFHRGAFRNPGATEHAARCAALVILDIQQDVIDSFRRATGVPGLKGADDIAILVEETDDNAEFARMVQRAVAAIDPAGAARIRVTPSLSRVQPTERARYLAAAPVTWDVTTRRELLDRLGRTGHPAARIDVEKAFVNVRIATLHAGDVLIEAATPSSFVYLPLGSGLMIAPLGGYHSFPAAPWLLLGTTGVVRGAERSATIVAERDVQVIMIPKSVYLAHWHHTLSLEEFQAAVARVRNDPPSGVDALSRLEKMGILQATSLFKDLTDEALAALAACAKDVHPAAHEPVIVTGTWGDSLFVVASGALTVRDSEGPGRTLGPGEVCGALAALMPGPRTQDVTAGARCHLLELTHADLRALISRHGDIAAAAMRMLAGHIDAQTAELQRLRTQLDPNVRTIAGM